MFRLFFCPLLIVSTARQCPVSSSSSSSWSSVSRSRFRKASAKRECLFLRLSSSFPSVCPHRQFGLVTFVTGLPFALVYAAIGVELRDLESSKKVSFLGCRFPPSLLLGPALSSLSCSCKKGTKSERKRNTRRKNPC